MNISHDIINQPTSDENECACSSSVPDKTGFSIPADVTTEQLKDLFGGDLFATKRVGCVPVKGAKGYGVAELEITETHRNALGNVMGGAIFTLCDFALAIAANVGECPTISIQSSISYLRTSHGNKLTATCTCDKSGRHVAFYTVRVVDDLDVEVALMTVTAYR